MFLTVFFQNSLLCIFYSHDSVDYLITGQSKKLIVIYATKSTNNTNFASNYYNYKVEFLILYQTDFLLYKYP